MLEDVYKSEQALLEHLEIQAEHIDANADAANADGADIKSIKDDRTALAFAMEFCVLATNFKDAAYDAKRALLRGGEDAGAGVVSAAPAFTPGAPFTPGLIKRCRERDQRFLKSKTMTDAARTALDLDGNDSDKGAEIITKPTLKAGGAASGYLLETEVSNRQESDRYVLQLRRMNQETWTDFKNATSKTLSSSVAPIVAGQPEQLQIRVQLFKKDQPYGEPSDPVYATVNP
jgi:hypothetical protein